MRCRPIVIRLNLLRIFRFAVDACVEPVKPDLLRHVPQQHPSAAEADVVHGESGSIVDKLLAATALLGAERKLLIACCDTPLLTPDIVSDVLDAVDEDAAFFHPLVSHEAAARDFPGHLLVPIKLKEGKVVTSNMFVVDPAVLQENPELVETIEKLRHHPIRMALRFGLGFLFRFKLGLLSLGYCERFFSKVLGQKCQGHIFDHTGLAMDLDRPGDVHLIESRLEA